MVKKNDVGENEVRMLMTEIRYHLPQGWGLPIREHLQMH